MRGACVRNVFRIPTLVLPAEAIAQGGLWLMMRQAQQAAEGEAKGEGSEDDGQGIFTHVLLGLHQSVLSTDGCGVVEVFGADGGGLVEVFGGLSGALGGILGGGDAALGRVLSGLCGVVGEVFGGLRQLVERRGAGVHESDGVGA